MANGEVIGSFNRGVNAPWLNGQNRATVNTVQTIKGDQRQNKTLGLSLPLGEFTGLIDVENLAAPLRHVFKLPDALPGLLGSLCFVKAPLKANAETILPESTFSQDER